MNKSKITFVIGNRDFDGYFEKLTKRLLEKVNNPKIKKVIINTGQYLPFEVGIKGITPEGTITLLWYSACRVMGRAATNEEIIDFIDNLEVDPTLMDISEIIRNKN